MVKRFAEYTGWQDIAADDFAAVAVAEVAAVGAETGRCRWVVKRRRDCEYYWKDRDADRPNWDLHLSCLSSWHLPMKRHRSNAVNRWCYWSHYKIGASVAVAVEASIGAVAVVVVDVAEDDAEGDYRTR